VNGKQKTRQVLMAATNADIQAILDRIQEGAPTVAQVRCFMEWAVEQRKDLPDDCNTPATWGIMESLLSTTTGR